MSIIVINRLQLSVTVFCGMFCGIFYSGLTKTSTALPRLSSKRTIL
ncbi:branched-chain amino acid permease [Neisseria meningitidis]|nr:branched-chain amino acid permease [Neisseria meningitidis]MBG8582356.1 branched-chain amino acid permease [Neisseria meningitidis]MBG8595130.1 branched-chain amino acid permease [Neisseria meningitidis]MBG8637157.1 branched-chain amino acid permease [Neisseria meningitidis]MBG8654873.1 branched-chain amino acid permease [Neisseria meningitidis]MBG8657211.1 branched-chain amino acid permease [Neisseria meningitidis]